jgi:hypothetical protein
LILLFQKIPPLDFLSEFLSYLKSSTGILGTVWNERKVKKSKEMLWFPNASNFESCVVHSLAGYIILGNGSTHLTNPKVKGLPLLPQFAGGKEGKCATHINEVVKTFENSNIEGLPPKATTSDFRAGMANYIAYHKNGSLDLAIARTGHNCTSLNTIFEYIEGTPLGNITAGRLVAEFHNSEANIYPPTIDVITNDDNREQLISIQSELFDNRVNMTNLRNTRDLVPLMFAVQLRHLDACIKKFGREDLVVTAIFNACKKYGVRKNTVLEWGNVIQKDFIKKNSETFINERQVVLDSIGKLTEDYSKLNDKYEHLLKSSDETNRLLSQLLKATTDTTVSSIKENN